MANNKTYTVMKDGKELKELKTLVSAKKLADAEGAEVLCEGECVYQGTVTDSEDTLPELNKELLVMMVSVLLTTSVLLVLFLICLKMQLNL